MLSIYPRVFRIYMPHRSFLLCYPCISVPWPLLLNNILGGHDWASLEMHLEAKNEWTQRCTWRPWSSQFLHVHGGRDSELRDPLVGCDWASLDMHFETGMEWTQRCTGRSSSSEFGHALGGRDRVNSEMHSEADTARVWTWTCRLWSSEIGGVVGGGRFGGRRNSSWDSIYWLTCNCWNVQSWVQHALRDEKLAGSGRLSVLGWCCT